MDELIEEIHYDFTFDKCGNIVMLCGDDGAACEKIEYTSKGENIFRQKSRINKKYTFDKKQMNKLRKIETQDANKETEYRFNYDENNKIESIFYFENDSFARAYIFIYEASNLNSISIFGVNDSMLNKLNFYYQNDTTIVDIYKDSVQIDKFVIVGTKKRWY